MAGADKNAEDGKPTATAGATRQVQLEMAQRLAREALRDDHHAFQVSVRNSRG
jgi:hypothetical protein